ncbi:MAG: hypothetical protein HZB68_05970 [Candidatus Aenigmarchaeota archaeon]|nr:hypothetical protein [Candidatus Aenigmarchaeota archaeon]
MDDRTQKEAIKLADKIYQRLQKEKRVYWSSALELANNDEAMMDLMLKALKARNIETGSPRKPYIEKSTKNLPPFQYTA